MTTESPTRMTEGVHAEHEAPLPFFDPDDVIERSVAFRRKRLVKVRYPPRIRCGSPGRIGTRDQPVNSLTLPPIQRGSSPARRGGTACGFELRNELRRLENTQLRPGEPRRGAWRFASPRHGLKSIDVGNEATSAPLPPARSRQRTPSKSFGNLIWIDYCPSASRLVPSRPGAPLGEMGVAV
jgi:hypothetical protein